MSPENAPRLPGEGAVPLLHDFRGVWLSPEWILGGSPALNESEVRARVRSTVETLGKRGVNAILLETLIRGTSVAVDGATPIFDYLQWNFARRGACIIDLLQIFIDEARVAGVAVHAWVHLFYWRMDNDDVYLPWQRARSLWDPLLIAWLEEQGSALRRTGKHVALAVAMHELSASLRRVGVDPPSQVATLASAGVPSGGHLVGRLVREALSCGCVPPDFLLMHSPSDPFPPAPRRALCPVYLDPGNVGVCNLIVDAIIGLARAHPDLAGIHLDQIRYPLDGQGLPYDLDVHDREPLYLNRTIPVMAVRRELLLREVDRRKQILSRVVADIHDRLPRHMMLSAAVLPLYYIERSDGVDRVNGYDYSAQDWLSWPLRFVVPMMYGFDPWKIRVLLRRYEEMARATVRKRVPPVVVPGVNRLRMTLDGRLGSNNWVFFDSGPGLDTRYEQEHRADQGWTPRTPPHSAR